jgi:hypothetical protein
MLRYLIHDSRYKDVWDAWIMFLAIVAGIEIPLRLVLHYPETDLIFAMDLTLTLFFSLDLIINLMPLLPDEDGEEDEEEIKSSKINFKYLKSWFIVDFMAAFPFGLFLAGIPFDTTHGIKALRLLRLTRLLKLAKMVPLIRKWGAFLSVNPSVLRMFLFFFLVSFAAHWMACGWIALYPGIVTGDASRTYIQAIYWVITTMTTVGYGDITPTTNFQTIYAMFVMVLGVGTYGYIIANLSNFFGNIDTAKIDFTKKMAIVNAFLAYRAIPPHLEKRIRAYYEYIWENRLDHDEDEVIDDLPDSLKTEVALYLRKPLISKVPLFRDAAHDFHQEVVHHLNIHVYMPGDKVVKRGDRGDSMFFISKGNVAILDDDDNHSLAVLGEGSFFGETSLLTAQPRNATVKALEFCNIYSLDKMSFDLLLKKYPKFKSAMEKISEERENTSQENDEVTSE